ncbi:MAG: gliding motility-associated ABC transporter substrate-binding protein GldG [Capnocytophaga sp.]|nr:gliding motility-associated ABC transporter substrate-binding protein GldG [Capnocytophaga sp.]
MKKINIQSVYFLVVTIIILSGIMVLSRFFYTRFDLTQDKRYTLSKTTLDVLQSIDNPILIQVLMKDNIPAEYKRLQNETLQLLEEYRAKNRNIQFQFINPLADTENPEKEIQQLRYEGFIPLQIAISKEGKTSYEYIFPWAVISQGEKIEQVALLRNKLGASDQEKVQFSVQNLENSITDGIYKLVLKKQKNIAFLRSNGTLSDIEMYDFLSLENQYYNIAPFSLDSVAVNPNKILTQLSDFQLLIIPKPTKKFTDEQKQVLDQYIMNGGRVLWLLDQVNISLSDIYENNGTAMAMPLDLNLGDMLFKYGVRVNLDLLSDQYCTNIVVANGSGSQSQYIPLPWIYNPLLLSKNNHLINNNLDGVRLQFANSIDTLANSVKKSVLLSSSPLSMLEGTPREIQLDISNKIEEMKDNLKGQVPVAVLLEGIFTSMYKNRVKPLQLSENQEESKATKMIIISDGDVIRNDINRNEPLELGYDKWTNNFYDNKIFLQNCVNYLLDDVSFLQLRNKKVALAFLDKKKIKEDQKQWQLLSFLVPLLGLLFLGGIVQIFYKKQFIS